MKAVATHGPQFFPLCGIVSGSATVEASVTAASDVGYLWRPIQRLIQTRRYSEEFSSSIQN